VVQRFQVPGSRHGPAQVVWSDRPDLGHRKVLADAYATGDPAHLLGAGARTVFRARPVRQPSAELLGKSDDDPVGASDVAEPIDVLILRQLADEFGAVGTQAGKDVLDVVDGEHDSTNT
jgi:hypothetical protein